MTDPSSHEEGDVKVIKPTWNVENVMNTLEMGTYTTEPRGYSQMNWVGV